MSRLQRVISSGFLYARIGARFVGTGRPSPRVASFSTSGVARSAYNVSVKWEHENDPNRLSFVGTDARGQKMKMAPSKSEGLEGVAPMQALLMALGGCSMYDIVAILKKQRQPLKDVDIAISGDRAEETPNPWKTIKMTVHLYPEAGKTLDPKKAEQACKLAIEKYCGVHATISGGGKTDITWGIEVHNS
ncbi:OsmC/Ohr family [Hyaloraphidium curvatum]|nr:OsmC/Ohr family [Hyaloraphidium curvatum]